VDRSGPSADDSATALAQKRSEAVRDFLVSHGVRRGLFNATTDDGTRTPDEIQGRRIEIVIESTQRGR
jgi:outer membrane protein OmpA-like peptidoglycan-associated protein